MRYIGNKTKLLGFISSFLADKKISPGSALDAFAGTASVSLPLYMVVESAESESGFHARSAETEAELGEDLTRLRAGMGPSLKRVKDFGGRVRPELSYPPMSMEGETD